jgi:hypothetical protein
MKHDLNLKTQVKQILKVVQELAPGRSVELRIPPYAAIQCVGGGIHRRGTPPNVVEMKAEILISLLESPDHWQEFCDSGAISASGTNSNLGNLFVQVSKLMNSEVRSENGE